ncbi:MAG: FMN-binding protein [Elusimicrobia bacterium]|nr:FMN-binding protein [Elusimicrobiota bacterium]
MATRRRTSNHLILAFLLLVHAGNLAWSKSGDRSYPEFVEQVFLTEEGALKSVFPDSENVDRDVHAFTEVERKKIESRLGWTLSEKEVTVYRGYRNGAPSGYALITEEIGKFKPITFIVKTSNEGKIERIEIMVYRESVGSEVKRQRFLRQFRGKRAKDPLRINRDILNVTGATMSVQAITAGTKKVLVILEELYLKK